MKNIGKKGIMALTVSGLLIGGIGLVNAQQGAAPVNPESSVSGELLAQRGPGRGGFHQGQGQRGGDARPDMMQRGQGFGSPMRGLSLGSTVDISFYEGDPEDGGTLLNSLSFTAGEDSEVAFRESLQEAHQEASFVVHNVSEQTRTIDLSLSQDNRGPRNGLARGLMGRNLNDGSTITATTYDADPAEGGNVLETFTFNYGLDSAQGFAADVQAATEDAAFLTVTTSPQTRTIDLSARQQAPFGQRGGFGLGHR